jgi:surface antigen
MGRENYINSESRVAMFFFDILWKTERSNTTGEVTAATNYPDGHTRFSEKK